MSTMLARELVMSYGWNATCYQILNPGIEHWFSSTAPGVVGYTRRLGVLLVAGAPVCAAETLPEICSEFEDYARAQNCQGLLCLCSGALAYAVCRFIRALHRDTGRAAGVGPSHLAAACSGSLFFRAQLNRCRNKDVIVEPAVPDEAAGDPELRPCCRNG